jgi:hypothetical protein
VAAETRIRTDSNGTDRIRGRGSTTCRRTGATALITALAAVIAGCGSNSASPAPTVTPIPITATPVPATATPIVVTATPKPAHTAAPVKTVKVVKVVVTATPAPTATATLRPGARYTPQPVTGKVTPVPGATPVKPAPGLVLGMIVHPVATVQTAQSQANAGNKAYLFYLHPTSVIQKTLPQYGFRPPIKIASPARPVKSYSGRPVQKADVSYQGQLYEVYVAQPATRGPKGVWFIVTILRQHLILGGITHSPTAVARLQALANTGNKHYTPYLNSISAMQVALPQYGFKPGQIQITQAPRTITSTTGKPEEQALVKFMGDVYYVDLSQLATTGPKGIWLIVGIFRAV